VTLELWTAPYGYRGPDRLDVTRRGAEVRARRGEPPGPGAAFAPSRALLDDFRRRERAGGRTEDLWAWYAAAYRGEMRLSWTHARPQWEAALAHSQLTLVCFCNLEGRAPQCHRVLLADLLSLAGVALARPVALRGERPPAREAGAQLALGIGAARPPR
jgi:uncharacterized protein YeaO (DUF488 family)